MRGASTRIHTHFGRRPQPLPEMDATRLPITLALFGSMQRWQARRVFRTLGISPGPDKRGFLGYLFGFRVLTSAAALRGYGQFLLGSGRRWQ